MRVWLKHGTKSLEEMIRNSLVKRRGIVVARYVGSQMSCGKMGLYLQHVR